MEDNITKETFESIDISRFLLGDCAERSVAEITESAADTVVRYKEMRMRYACAIKEVKTKFDVLNSEFSVRYSRNPISSITSRLKSTASIAEKIERRGVELNLDNIERYVRDIAGIRIICSYIDDIYMLADALKSQDDITVIAVKDYIRNPKPNGYRSLHLVVSVPVFFANQTSHMTVEVQIRTIAMDFWASLEHEMKYKKSAKEPEEISRKLKDCAETIAEVDRQMLDIRCQIDENSQALTEREILLNRLLHIDSPIGID